jgi:hypothetical protein
MHTKLGPKGNDMSVEQDFWKWFILHEAELFNFEADQERIFGQLAAELRKIDPDLVFEFGPKDAKREFVVSAGGIRRAFSSVSALVAAAPRLERWEIVAFRPRRPAFVIALGAKRIDPHDVQASLLHDGRNVGILLFIPGFNEDDADWKQLGYLMLDNALGEYDVESRVGIIRMFSPEVETKAERFSMTELATRFDVLTARLSRNTRDSLQ